MTTSHRDAFAAFAAARGSALHRAAYLMVGDAHLAQDLVQESLTKLYVAWPRVREPEAYCRRTITTTAISWMRRRSWGERPVAEHADHADHAVWADHAGPAPRVADHDSRIDLWRAVEALPPRQRVALVLRYYEDLTEAQTAEAMDCAVGTVKSQTAAALRALRATLGEDAVLVPALSGGDLS